MECHLRQYFIRAGIVFKIKLFVVSIIAQQVGMRPAENIFFYNYVQGLNPTNAFISFSSFYFIKGFYPLITFGQ